MSVVTRAMVPRRATTTVPVSSDSSAAQAVADRVDVGHPRADRTAGGVAGEVDDLRRGCSGCDRRHAREASPRPRSATVDRSCGLHRGDLQLRRRTARLRESTAPGVSALPPMTRTRPRASLAAVRARQRPRRSITGVTTTASAGDGERHPAPPGHAKRIEPRTEAPADEPATSDLRARLARIDPMRPGAADLPTPSLDGCRDRRSARMQSLIETDLDAPASLSSTGAPWRRPRLVAAAAAGPGSWMTRRAGAVCRLPPATTSRTLGGQPRHDRSPWRCRETARVRPPRRCAIASSVAILRRACRVAFAGTVEPTVLLPTPFDARRRTAGTRCGLRSA